MVQDKVSGAYNDISVTPVKHTVVAVSYYAATFLATLIINLVALIAGLIYVAAIGWYLTVSDVLFLILDILLAVFKEPCNYLGVPRVLGVEETYTRVGVLQQEVYHFLSSTHT